MGSELLLVCDVLVYMSAFKMQPIPWEAIIIDFSDPKQTSPYLHSASVLAAFTTLLWVYGHKRVRHACKLLLQDITCRRRKVGCTGSAKAHVRCCIHFQGLALPGNHAVKKRYPPPAITGAQGTPHAYLKGCKG